MEGVILALCVHVCLTRKEDEEGEGLENVETRKGTDVVFELEAKDL